MTFKCERCGRLTEPGERTFRVPVCLRPKTYQAIKIRDGWKRGGTGYEILREQLLCFNCAPEAERLHRARVALLEGWKNRGEL